MQQRVKVLFHALCEVKHEIFGLRRLLSIFFFKIRTECTHFEEFAQCEVV